MIQIDLNNNKFKLSGNLKVLKKIYDDLKVKHPNAYFLRPYMEKGWDGKIKFLSDSGYAKTGLLPLVTSLIEEYGEKYTINDNRILLEIGEIPYKVGEFELRGYQREAVESIVYNEVGNIPYYRGVIEAATNAGKTLIAAGIYKSFKNAKALILLKEKTLYDQFIDDMPKFFGDNWGYMQGKNIKWGDIMVCMTPTLVNRLDVFSNKLSSYNIVLFDECHLVTSKTNKKVLNKLYNTTIRVGLSGTPFSHKNPVNNMEVRSFFGDSVYTISNLELMDEGWSSRVIIKIVKGNTKVKIRDYREEYREAITINDERMDILCSRVDYYIKHKRTPILVVGRYHEHVENMYNVIYERFGKDNSIAFIHGDIDNRKDLLDDFKKGGLDILVSSLIIKIGQNMPLIKTLINAASGDSQITAIQLLGRATRKHESKTKVYYEDFHDEGYYLKRHSNHRIKWYKNQGLKVIELWKK